MRTSKLMFTAALLVSVTAIAQQLLWSHDNRPRPQPRRSRPDQRLLWSRPRPLTPQICRKRQLCMPRKRRSL